MCMYYKFKLNPHEYSVFVVRQWTSHPTPKSDTSVVFNT